MPRETRIERLMIETGMGRMQAVNVIRDRDCSRSAMRRDPRAFDNRFQG